MLSKYGTQERYFGFCGFSGDDFIGARGLHKYARDDVR
jgi:hypothetical protein